MWEQVAPTPSGALRLGRSKQCWHGPWWDGLSGARDSAAWVPGLQSQLTPFLQQEKPPDLSPLAGLTGCVGADVLLSPPPPAQNSPHLGDRRPSHQTTAHSLLQLVLGSTVHAGIREDASVSRGGREGVTSTVPAMMSRVTG